MWGQYRNGSDARACLSAYAEAIYGHPVGLIWTSGSGTTWLRAPNFDAEGHGLSLLVRCTPAPPPPPIQVPSRMQRLEAAIAHFTEAAAAVGPMVLERQFNLPPGTFHWLNEHIVAPVDRLLDRHPLVKEGIIVVADVVGVVAGAAAVVTLFTVGGTAAVVVGLAATVLAGAACLALLVEDAQHWWYVARHNEAARIALEKSAHYQWIQAVAPWLTLPDLALGGRAVVREAVEATKVARTAAPRVARYAERADRASSNLRQTIAEDNTAQAIRQAGMEAQRRAAQLQRMQMAANRATRNMLLKHNAVAATAGSLWAARQYVHEPPALLQQALGGSHEHERNSAAHEAIARQFNGTPARHGSPAHLLTPRHPVPGAAHSNLHITPVVTRRVHAR